jgi:hypothetical protein
MLDHVDIKMDIVEVLSMWSDIMTTLMRWQQCMPKVCFYVMYEPHKHVKLCKWWVFVAF